MENEFDKTESDEYLAAVVQGQVMPESHDAFEELVNRYEQKMTRYANKFLYTYEDRQDAVQEVFLKSYKNIQSFRTSERFSPWIYRVAHNTFINIIKKQKRETVTSLDMDTFFTWNVADERVPEARETELEREVLEQCLGALDIKYREVLVLFYFEEKDYKEIAEILQIPTATVGVRLRRGRKKMEEIYKQLNK